MAKNHVWLSYRMRLLCSSPYIWLILALLGTWPCFWSWSTQYTQQLCLRTSISHQPVLQRLAAVSFICIFTYQSLLLWLNSKSSGQPASDTGMMETRWSLKWVALQRVAFQADTSWALQCLVHSYITDSRSKVGVWHPVNSIFSRACRRWYAHNIQSWVLTSQHSTLINLPPSTIQVIICLESHKIQYAPST